jgi:tetratricopeptide (TPR) repeat protein
MPEPILPAEPEAFSLLGAPLYRQPMRAEIYESQKKLYDAALKNYLKNREDPDNILWLGRRTAYLGRYREACAIFSIGAEKHPENPWFPRHRGHRFLTMRLIDRAVDDFEKAAKLMEGMPHSIEPDGIPNDRNTPVSSLQTNVWYHLGLARYIQGDWKRAAEAYKKGIEAWEINDNYASFANWYYLALRRMGKDAQAEKVLKRAEPGMDLIENQGYLDLLLLYKGVYKPKELLEKKGLRYGIAAWHLINGEEKKAEKLLKDILSSEEWAAFNHLAAEAEYKRIQKA